MKLSDVVIIYHYFGFGEKKHQIYSIDKTLGLLTFQRIFLQLQVVVNENAEVSITDFEFVGGILFPDIISLNFTLSVDPEKERPVGSGDAQTAIVMHPICIQSVFQSWPADTSTYVGCGSMYAEPFISTSPGKYSF